MKSRLKPWGPADVPPQAAALYDRREQPLDRIEELAELAWTVGWRAKVHRVFHTLFWVFVYTADEPGQDRWGWWTKFWRKVGNRWRLMHAGDCDDFAAEIIRRLVRAGVPRGALRLTECLVSGVRHAVVTLETSRGTLVICNIAKVCWLGSPKLRDHVFTRRETAGGNWERCDTATLADFLPKAKELMK